MKADEARQIQARASAKNLAREDAKKLHQELAAEFHRYESAHHAILDRVRSLVIEEATRGSFYAPIPNELLKEVRTSAVEAVIAARSAKKSFDPFPPIFRPFDKKYGFGLVSSRAMSRCLSDYAAQHLHDMAKKKSEYSRQISDAIMNFDSSNLDVIDQKVLSNLGQKVEKKKILEDDELLAAVGILGRTTIALPIDYRQAFQENAASGDYEAAVKLSHFFADLSSTCDVTVIWNCDASPFPGSLRIPKSLHGTSNLGELSTAKPDTNSPDILSNPALLSWLTSISGFAVLNACFDFVAKCAEDLKRSCRIKLIDQEIQMIEGSHKHRLTIRDIDYPQLTVARSVDFWMSIFCGNGYLVKPEARENEFRVSW